ncbi:hypothetical protein [Variovorax sp. JS1663]|uniref:hypothetical protein n=1 Tax=Variovorax sp. JS1663 TaxID=1851577 RepID=UPI000B6CF281|nr:hypothetical protein [Variovorax sp. JS1663]OUM00739.1 hypothetical protein A8M77_19835 [Variovorax sp. JS1663]
MSRAIQTQKRLQAEVDAFNDHVPLGAEVDYFEYEGAPLVRFKTRTLAQILSGHTAVVWLEGKSGCVCTSHCIPVTTEATAGAAR